MQLLGCNLWSCSAVVAEHLKEFALNLVSANGACLHACMDLFVRSFAPPIGHTSAAPPISAPGDSAPADAQDPDLRKVRAASHRNKPLGKHPSCTPLRTIP